MQAPPQIMTRHPDDLCPRPKPPPAGPTRPLATPIYPTPLYPTSVYQCASPEEAAALLAHEAPGYVYSRDGHPNAVQLADTCAALHGADRATVTGSGMAALALAMLSQLTRGDHLVVGNVLYGRSLKLLSVESARLGITSTLVDACDLRAVAAALTDKTRLVVVETIGNPRLRVPDLAELAELAHRRGARLLADNSLASPIVCRPIEFGADLVMESITKIINGHSDVTLGLLCGTAAAWSAGASDIADVQSTWGFFASPWDCWLATRGLATLHLRSPRASANAAAVAEFLSGRADLEEVVYPALASHPDHAVAARQFRGQFGNMVSFTLPGGTAAARRFIAAAEAIPFCPSLGEAVTTLTHPESTSHRTLSAEARRQLGIGGGMIRLSVGIESAEYIVSALEAALAAAKLS